MSHGITNTDHMFSVRQLPWHGLGVVLDEYPKSIDEALDKAGLGWQVTHGDVLVVKAPEWTDDFGSKHPQELVPANGFKANLRQDTGDVLGIVADEYEVVDKPRRLPLPGRTDLVGLALRDRWQPVGRPARLVPGPAARVRRARGDLCATYVYVANSHDGSMAVTAAVTPIRIVCANTLGAALHQAEHGINAHRTFRFRHTGNLQAKFADARQVLGMALNYQRQFKQLADRLALEPITEYRVEHGVLRYL